VIYVNYVSRSYLLTVEPSESKTSDTKTDFHSRSFILQSIRSRQEIAYRRAYNNAGLISKFSEEVATEDVVDTVNLLYVVYNKSRTNHSKGVWTL